MHRHLTPALFGSGSALAVMVLCGMQPTGSAIVFLTIAAVWLGALITATFSKDR